MKKLISGLCAGSLAATFALTSVPATAAAARTARQASMSLLFVTFPPVTRKMSRFDRPAARALRDLLYAVKLVQHKYPHIIRILERIGAHRRTAGGGAVRP